MPLASQAPIEVAEAPPVTHGHHGFHIMSAAYAAEAAPRGGHAWAIEVGYGHDAQWWKEFISTLRMFGYDYVLSIEHEDSLMSPEEGLSKAASFLNAIVIKEKPGAAWWV